MQTTPLTLPVEAGLNLAVTVRHRPRKGRLPACLLLHLDGADAALKDPVAAALLTAGWVVYALQLRATGPAGGEVRRRHRITTMPNTPSGSAGRCWGNGSLMCGPLLSSWSASLN